MNAEALSPTGARRRFVLPDSLGVFLVTAVCYLVFFNRYASPDESTAAMIQHLRLIPFQSLAHPLWGSILRALVALNVDPLPFLPNLFSLLCGAACVALLYQLVARSALPRAITKSAEPQVRMIGGLAAAVALATAPPFWREALRAHFATFDLMLFLGALRLLQAYRESDRVGALLGSVALYGLAIAEFATAIPILPFYLGYVIVLMARKQHLRPGLVLGVFVCLAPAALVYAWGAYDAHQSAGTTWREVTSPWQAFLRHGSEQKNLLLEWPRFRASPFVPSWGNRLLFFWPIIAAESLIPWLFAFLVLRRLADREGDSELYVHILHGVLAVWAVAILIAPESISPWAICRLEYLMVTPFVLVAAAVGYAAAYWFGTIAAALEDRETPLPPPGWFFRVVLIAMAVVLVIRNNKFATTLGNRDWHLVMNAMLDQVKGRSAVLTDGLYDASLHLETADRNENLRLINFRFKDFEPYRRYIASTLKDDRQRTVAQLALVLYVSESMRNDPAVTDSLAVQLGPDVWIEHGINPMPSGWVYLGARNRTNIDVRAVMAGQTSFWSQVEAPLARLRKVEMKRGLPVSRLALHFSRLANDLGIFLEEAKEMAGAEQAYRQALAFTSMNPATLLNLERLLLTGGRSNDAAVVKGDVEKVAMAYKGMQVASLARTFGHIRAKTSLDRLIDLWKVKAEAKVWDAELNRAVQFYTQKDMVKSRQVLEDIVRVDSSVEQAWLLLGAIAFDTNDQALMDRCNAQMLKSRRDWPQLVLLQAEWAARKGDNELAQKLYERVAQIWPSNIRVLEILTSRYLGVRDYAKLQPAITALIAVDPESPLGNFALGLLMLSQQDKKLAVDAFRTSIKKQKNLPAMNNLAWLLAEQGDWREAMPLAEEAVATAPGSADVWDTLGYVHMQASNWPKAHEALKKALELDPTHVSARCRWAQVLYRMGEAAQAKEQARQLLLGPDQLESDQIKALEAIVHG